MRGDAKDLNWTSQQLAASSFYPHWLVKHLGNQTAQGRSAVLEDKRLKSCSRVERAFSLQAVI